MIHSCTEESQVTHTVNHICFDVELGMWPLILWPGTLPVYGYFMFPARDVGHIDICATHKQNVLFLSPAHCIGTSTGHCITLPSIASFVHNAALANAAFSNVIIFIKVKFQFLKARFLLIPGQISRVENLRKDIILPWCKKNNRKTKCLVACNFCW